VGSILKEKVIMVARDEVLHGEEKRIQANGL
jgi:hypothetical protein